jgi:hypothetical protein
MKNVGTITRLLPGIGLGLMILLWSGCDPTLQDTDKNELKTELLQPLEVEGGKYPYVPSDPDRLLNLEDSPYIVPAGPKRGELEPLNEKFEIKQLKPDEPGGASQAPLHFEDLDELDDATPNAHNVLPEPSVAENGQVIMHTGNDWMSLSLDGGLTFTTVHPTTIFPNDYGGYCCDQVLSYVPEYDIFVWLLQYWSKDGVNAIRIAVQNTQGVTNSNGTAWTYWDFRNTVFANSGTLDYNDMSFGNTFLYWTSSVGGGSKRYVVRVPLKELQAKGTVNFGYTGATDAFWSHVTQSGRNGVYWAGHKNNSTMLVYSMMDADGFYSWREVSINSWPNNTISSIAKDGKDWLDDASWKTYVRAAAVKGNSAFFAWNASSGDGFPEPHVQIVEINTSNWTLTNQMQIWNPDFAFAYPNFDFNAEGELGMIVGFGGTNYNASNGVGVWGDFVIYYPRLSGMSRTNYGHYLTARRSGSQPLKWVGAGYTYEADGTVLPYYVRYHH